MNEHFTMSSSTGNTIIMDVNDLTSSISMSNTTDTNDTTTADVCEICGWMAAICSAFAFGTFAVPIKSHIAQTLDIDPFIMQSYKTMMVMITSIIHVVFFMKQSILYTPFTPWGIVSGLFWVPSGIATIYAVKTIGLALGIGIASSLIVMVSFIWGIFIFHEPIHSQMGACIAIFCMMMGLFGMSYYSVPPSLSSTSTSTLSSSSVSSTSPTTTTRNDGNSLPTIYEEVVTSVDDEDYDDKNDDDTRLHSSIDHHQQPQPYRDDIETNLEISTKIVHRTKIQNNNSNSSILDDNSRNNHHHHAINDSMMYDKIDNPPSTTECIDNDTEEEEGHQLQQSSTYNTNTGIVRYDHELTQHVYMYGYKVSKRHLGMCSAAFCGLYGGSIMAPMKFANTNIKGTHYLFSFAIGATLVTIVLWIIRYCYYVYYYQSFYDAYHQLPSFYIRQMWCVGGTCGLIWSIGNYFSLISVYYLGEGVGYPLVQTSILISGLWGLFYFKEIQGIERITKWLLSSLMTVCGILLLSYEHHTK